MKKLLLIRHAKAVQDSKYADFERPLTQSGSRDAEMMAERLHRLGFRPALVISSPALRALATADILSEFLSLQRPREERSVYEANRIDLLKVVNTFEDAHEFVALVGHNPGIEEFAGALSAQDIDFRTCGMALIEFDAEQWSAVSFGTGKLRWLSSPKKEI